MSRFTLTLTLCSILVSLPAAADPLHVVTSTPDLADLVHQVGGDEIDATSLVRGPQDPHFLDPRPTFVRQLHDADLYVEVGLGLEVGWSPVLQKAARNPAIRPGGERYVDASRAIVPLDVPTGAVDRSQGDVHAGGNPHYLSDPLNGLRVARLLAERLAAVRPEAAAKFEAGAAAFERAVLERLVGAELAASRPAPELVAALDEGRLDALGGEAALGGWLGQLRAAQGVLAIEDHRLWPYFAKRFGLVLVGELEPIPGIAPTTAHLTQVVALVKERGVRLLLASPYFDARHARTVADRTGIPVVTLAHQTGALPGADDYLSTVGRNVKAVADALDAH